MSTRQRSHPGFEALVDCVVRDLEGHGITLTPELVHDELRLLLRHEGSGGLPEDQRHDLLGPEACHRWADRLRRRLQLPDLGRSGTTSSATADAPEQPRVDEHEPCSVVDLAERRRRGR